MPTTIRHAVAPSPWRVTVYLDESFVGSDDATLYRLRRAGAVEHTIESAWGRGVGVVELALGEPLLAGEPYTLTHTSSASTVGVAYHEPVTPPVAPPLAVLDGDVPDDPEAEAFGVDVDWLAPALTSRGDFPAPRGIAAFRHDLAALTFTIPGELIHRPGAGLGIQRRVNQHATDTTLEEVGAEVSEGYREDDRVRDVSVSLTRDPRGVALLRVSVAPAPLEGETLDFTVRL